MKVQFAGQVPKHLAYPEANEDAFEISEIKGRLALSDGASESFDSKSWAKLLVTRFVDDPGLSQDWLAKLISDFLNLFDYTALTWSKQSSFDRGSFATLLGVEECNNDGTVDILSVGDSLAVLLDGTRLVDSYPYIKAEDFQQRPELFCTGSAHNSFFANSNFFSQHHKTWHIASITRPSILCMTDALGEWALKNEEEGNPCWEMLASIETYEQMESLVVTERESKRMKIDDATLVRLSFDKVDEIELPNS